MKKHDMKKYDAVVRERKEKKRLESIERREKEIERTLKEIAKNTKKGERDLSGAEICYVMIAAFIGFILLGLIVSGGDGNSSKKSTAAPSQQQKTTGLHPGTYATKIKTDTPVYCTDTLETLGTVTVNPPKDVVVDLVQRGKLTLIAEAQQQVLILDRAFFRRKIRVTDVNGSTWDCWLPHDFLHNPN